MTNFTENMSKRKKLHKSRYKIQILDQLSQISMSALWMYYIINNEFEISHHHLALGHTWHSVHLALGYTWPSVHLALGHTWHSVPLTLGHLALSPNTGFYIPAVDERQEGQGCLWLMSLVAIFTLYSLYVFHFQNQ